MPVATSQLAKSQSLHEFEENGVGVNFQSEFLAIKDWTKDPSRLGLTPRELEKRLNLIEDNLLNYKNVHKTIQDDYEILQSYVGCFSCHSAALRLKLLGAIFTGFAKYVGFLEDVAKFESAHGLACGYFAVLITALVSEACKLSPDSNSSAGRKEKDNFDWAHLRIPLLESVRRLFDLEMARFLDSSLNRQAIVSNLLKSAHLMLENQNFCKCSKMRRAIWDIFVSAALRQDSAGTLKTIILQDLNYFEWLAEPIADFIKLLSEKEENFTLTREIFSHIGAHHFSSSTESASIKIISTFLSHSARLVPKEVLRNISVLIDQIDCESYVMRMAVVEILGHILSYLSSGDKTDQTKAQTKSFLSVLQERLFDVNAFVRSKVLFVFGDVLKAGAVPVDSRPQVLQAVISRIPDKSSNVRRKAIQLLGDFLRTHPFCVEGGELSLKHFEEHLRETDLAIARLGESTLESEEDANRLTTLMVQKQYYTDAIQFVRQIESVIPTLSLLLSSKTKGEVVDVIEFFVECHAYNVDKASLGLRKMMHLIWERELSSEDGTKHSTSEVLLDAYRRIYLETDARLSGKEKCEVVAGNILSIMDNISLAELASLEKIIAGMLEKKWISDGIVHALFSMLSQNKKGALVLLALMSNVKPSIVVPRLDIILRQGFGPSTTVMEAKYTCIALRSLGESGGRLANDNPVFGKILDLIRVTCLKPAWYEVINEALKTIYFLAVQPGILCEAFIKDLYGEVFDRMETEDNASSVESLSRLIHIAGQVAICQSNHLDSIEQHWKSRQKAPEAASDELQMISGTADDEFSDLVLQVKDHEILYGDDSLLTLFGPLVAHICGNQNAFPNQILQRVASLTLAKFMSISSIFCQQNLALFLTILEKSGDSVVRSNYVIAFGDLIQSFGRIIDQNSSFLFARLSDSDSLVRRNCLMVLTHLTLTGMIKIKGQIGDIARCILDEDQRVADLSRLFFHELATKDSTIIYNHIPDMLSSLSAPGQVPLEYDDFQKIIKFVFDFVKKEKQLESLLERLLQRFRLCTDVRQAREVAFCLSLCNFTNEKSLKKLVDAFPLYRERLADLPTFKCFSDILHKTKRNALRGGDGSKALLDGFEVELRKAGDNIEQNDDDPVFHSGSADNKTAKKLTGKKSAGRSKTLPGLLDDSELDSDEDSRKVGRKMLIDDDDHDMDIDQDDEEAILSGAEEPVPKPKAREKIVLPKRQFGGGSKVARKGLDSGPMSDAED